MANPLRVNVGNVTGDVTCSASFSLRSYTVSATVAGVGGAVGMSTITGEGRCDDTSCMASHGATVTFTAVPDVGADEDGCCAAAMPGV